MSASNPTHRGHVDPHVQPSTGARDSWKWLTTVAFVLLLCFVLARAMIFESDRDAGAAVRGAGPTTSLAMDLLCCLPAMLILLKRALDPTYRLQLNWSHALMALLAAWAAASVLWSGDRFIAATSASHFIAAMVVLWSASQLVRSWLRVRLLAGLLIGLLAGQVCQGLMYHYSDAPNTAHYFDEHKAQILREHGWREGDFAAMQFEKKLKSGEVMGFTASPNSFGAVLVLLGVIAMGWLAQRLADRKRHPIDTGDKKPRETDWAVGLVLLALVLAGLTIHFTGSRTAYITPVIALIFFAALWRWGGRLAARARSAYWIGVAILVASAAAIIGHGLAHGNLIQNSLTFRWRYWVGSMRLFLEHPLKGVGFANFGEHYLAHRLPIASEEIKDPHNFFVHFFTELGLVGGLLAVGWIARLWWELTRPTHPIDSPASASESAAPRSARSADRRSPLGFLAVVTIGAFLITILAAIDWSNDSGYVTMEVLRRILYFAAIYIGATAATARSLERPQWDIRPAGWILTGLLLAAALFLLHNQIDFSFFETGPMMLFVLVTGGALGARMAGRSAATGEPPPRRGVGALAALGVACALWAFAAIFFFIPTADAEQLVVQADRAAQTGDHTQAAQLLQGAFNRQPLNGGYIFRAADEAQRAGEPIAEISNLVNEAVRSDPYNFAYRLRRVQLELARPQPDAHAIDADFQKALALNPHDVPTRLQFAEVLEQWHRPADAIEQYQAALKTNAALEPADPRRLSLDRVDQIRKTVDSLAAPR